MIALVGSVLCLPGSVEVIFRLAQHRPLARRHPLPLTPPGDAIRDQLPENSGLDRPFVSLDSDAVRDGLGGEWPLVTPNRD